MKVESQLPPDPICLSKLLGHDCPSHVAWALVTAPFLDNPPLWAGSSPFSPFQITVPVPHLSLSILCSVFKGVWMPPPPGSPP